MSGRYSIYTHSHNSAVVGTVDTADLRGWTNSIPEGRLVPEGVEVEDESNRRDHHRLARLVVGAVGLESSAEKSCDSRNHLVHSHSHQKHSHIQSLRSQCRRVDYLHRHYSDMAKHENSQHSPFERVHQGLLAGQKYYRQHSDKDVQKGEEVDLGGYLSAGHGPH